MYRIIKQQPHYRDDEIIETNHQKKISEKFDTKPKQIWLFYEFDFVLTRTFLYIFFHMKLMIRPFKN